ncbi:PD-(D/E)XK nuclease family protein [Candidatus Woesearchaeota archaeon]|nr:PD-(D/E)XK nuclease family protein [Candidatus Woesearchaeota archaeon]
MAKRVQSPSSINTYRQCPRKYFYQYVIKLPTRENIHCVRGNVVHEALEHFFTLEPGTVDPMAWKKDLSCHLKKMFDSAWRRAGKRLKTVGLLDDQLEFYYEESVQMLANWLTHFFGDLEKELKTGKGFVEAFKKLAPHAMEKQYKDQELMVRGFIDVVHKDGDDIILVDYKTSKKAEVTEEYRLQLGIYALLYEREHGHYPSRLGIWFLKHKPIYINVDPKLIKFAESEIELIHFATESERIADYPKKESGLCKWSTGQCDFFDVCRKN